MPVISSAIDLNNPNNDSVITIDSGEITVIENVGTGAIVHVRGIYTPFAVTQTREVILEMIHKKFSEIEEFQTANRGNHQQDEMARLVTALKEVWTHSQTKGQSSPNCPIPEQTPGDGNFWFNDQNGQPLCVPVNMVEKIEFPEQIYCEKGIRSIIKIVNGLMVVSTDSVDELKSRLNHIASDKTNNQPQEPVFLFKDEQSRLLPLVLNAIKGVVKEVHVNGCSILEMKDGAHYYSNLTSKSLARELKECRKKYGFPTTKQVNTWVDVNGKSHSLSTEDISQMKILSTGGIVIVPSDGSAVIEIKDSDFTIEEVDI
jgi:hypothetical protein